MRLVVAVLASVLTACGGNAVEPGVAFCEGHVDGATEVSGTATVFVDDALVGPWRFEVDDSTAGDGVLSLIGCVIDDAGESWSLVFTAGLATPSSNVSITAGAPDDVGRATLGFVRRVDGDRDVYAPAVGSAFAGTVLGYDADAASLDANLGFTAVPSLQVEDDDEALTVTWDVSLRW